jgi:hypothetical protein
MPKQTKARGPLGNERTKKALETPPSVATLGTDATTDTGGGGFLGEEVEGFYIHSVASLAEVAGNINAFTLATFLRETGEFAECRPGQGIEGCFLISEAFALAVWGELSRCAGVSLGRAARIVPRSLDPYGLMRHGYTRLPLSLDPKRLGQPPLGGEPAIVVLDLGAIWQGFWPRFREYAVKHSPNRNMRAACAIFEDRVSRVREAIEAGLSCA